MKNDKRKLLKTEKVIKFFGTNWQKFYELWKIGINKVIEVVGYNNKKLLIVM